MGFPTWTLIKNRRGKCKVAVSLGLRWKVFTFKGLHNFSQVKNCKVETLHRRCKAAKGARLKNYFFPIVIKIFYYEY